MAERKVYTAEFKLEAVRLARLPERTVAQVADELGIGRSTLTAWLRQHREQGERAFPGHGRPALTPEEEENRRLRRELEITKQERDILKKATTFFAKESK
jgi:transposase